MRANRGASLLLRQTKKVDFVRPHARAQLSSGAVFQLIADSSMPKQRQLVSQKGRVKGT
jgi:hypothetical protein